MAENTQVTKSQREHIRERWQKADFTNRRKPISKIPYLRIMNLKDSIKVKPNEFITLCENHDVKTLYAFGSSVNGNFKEESSDIDLLIELNTEDPLQRGENLISLWDKFETFFQRKVDLLTNSSIRNPILRKSIDSSKILIYDGKEHKVSF